MGVAEVAVMGGGLVRVEGGRVAPGLQHDEAQGVGAVAVQVVLQAAGFAAAGGDQLAQGGFHRLGLAGLGVDVGDQVQRRGHGGSPGKMAHRLGYFAAQKNQLEGDSLSKEF